MEKLSEKFVLSIISFELSLLVRQCHLLYGIMHFNGYLSLKHPTNKKLALQTPTTILYRKSPSYSHLKVFGCLGFPLNPSTTRKNIQERSTPCVFLGYPSNHRGYKCFEFSIRKIIISTHSIGYFWSRVC